MLNGHHCGHPPGVLSSVITLLNHVSTLVDVTRRNSPIHILLDWIARLLKYPDTKPERAIVLVGPGKSLLVKLIGRLVGEDKVLTTTDDRVKYGEVENVRLIHFQDFEWRAIPRLNSLISDDVVHGVINTTGVIITTNVAPSEHARRLFVIEVGAQLSTDFYREFEAAIEDPRAIDGLRAFLVAREA